MRIERCKRKTLLLTTAVLLAGARPYSVSADDSGLAVNVAVDIVGSLASRGANANEAHIRPREAEIAFYGPIDHIFDGTLVLAAHQEGGKAFFEIHEAFLGSSKLIPNTRVRLGQFFLGVGKLNSTHRHDWLFVAAPAVQRNFFGAEGISDSGIEFAAHLPVSHPIELTAGITQGWTFGHSHDAGKKPKVPTHYASISTFLNLPLNGGLQATLNSMGRTDSEENKMTLIGLDSTLKWRRGKTIPFLIQSEVWWRSIEPRGERSSQAIGFYLYPQINIAEDLYFGTLFDQYEPTNLIDLTGQKVTQRSTSWTPTITWRPSEFSTFRFNYSWQLETNHNVKNKLRQAFFQFQSTFILGAHPAHDF